MRDAPFCILENYNIRKIVFARGWERGGRQGWGGLNQRMAQAIRMNHKAEKKKEHPVMGAP